MSILKPRLSDIGKRWIIEGLFSGGKVSYDEIRLRGLSERLMVIEFLHKGEVIAEGPEPLPRLIRHDISLTGLEGYLKVTFGRMKTSKCGSGSRPGCGAEIIWAKMASGARMPFDAIPDPNGLYRILEEHGEPFAIYVGVLDSNVLVGADFNRYTSHFATCPNSENFR